MIITTMCLFGTIDSQAQLFEDCETFTPGLPGTLANGWTTDPATGFRWEVEDATGANENSLDTGPFFDHTTEGVSGGIYMFTESSSGATGAVANLVSPSVSLTGFSCPKLKFWYHMFGETMGELHIDVNDGSGWDLDVALPIVGEQQDSGGAAWAEKQVPLGAYIGSTVQVRFRALRGASFTSDISLDDFTISDDSSPDVAVDVVSTTASTCNHGSSEIITITVANNSCTDIPASSVEATFEVVLGVPDGPYTETIPVAIPALSSVDYTFMTTADLDGGGLFSIEATASFTAASGLVDANAGNDTKSLDIFLQTPLTAPFQDFENFTAGVPPADGNLSEGWTSDPTAGYRWEVEDATGANENSTGTGPFFDHTTEGVSGGIYMFTEASSGVVGDEAMLVSPCIDLSSYVCPSVEFWYHMFGANSNMGELHVDINDGSGWDLDIVAPLIGQQQATGDAAWLRASGNIGAYAGQIVQIRFRGVRGTGFESDMSIDDFNIVDDLSDNIAITDLATSSDGCNPSNAETFSITVSNSSCNDIPAGSVDVTFEVTGGPVVVGPFTETITDAIPANSAVTYTFTNTADLSQLGNYTIDFSTGFNAGSGLTDSDLSDNSVLGIPLQTFNFFGTIDGNNPPYVESFEAGDGGWVVTDISGTTSTMVLGTPPAGQTNINAASDGTMAWFSDATLANNAGEFYNTNELIFFQTGCFDMSCMESATFSIDVNWDAEGAWDGATIGYNTDGGTTFFILGVQDATQTSGGNGINWYNDTDVDGIANEIDGWSGDCTGTDTACSGAWVSASHDISFLAGFSSVRFAVIFGSEGSGQQGEGFAFDNVQVTGNSTNPSCLGCTDMTACNYNPAAFYEDGSCEFTTCAGCTDTGACNYDSTATIDDGSCEYLTCAGCTDMTACNYNPSATISNPSACIYGSCGNGICEPICGETAANCADCVNSVLGCTDMTACNYNPSATDEDGSCEYTSCAGCTDMTACNYDSTATIEDGSCFYGSCGNGICEPFCGETATNCNDCAIRLGCTDPTAHNYRPRANQDDGSCETCTDGIQNGDETSIDCGGSKCVPCTSIVVNQIIGVSTTGGTGSVFVTVTSGTPGCALTYAWSGPGGYTATTEDITGLTMTGDYTLMVTDCAGRLQSATITVPTRGEGRGRGRKAEVVETVQLMAIPNPFANQTTISFEVNTEEQVSLDVFDIRGAKVATLFDQTAEAGQNYQIQFGDTMPSGTYIAKLTTANGHVQHIKLFLTK
ncbi:MAG: T9SS type A sorting domain-containing protein [Chitinophagales bacterium]